jgi:hypothetical protein
MNDLVKRLSDGFHPVTYRARRGDARKELKDAVEQRYVHLLFTETKGGTELGFAVDEKASDVSRVDWDNGEGSLQLEGTIKLDGVRVRCVATLDVATMLGAGHLVVL